MEVISALSWAGNYLATIRISDAVDILIVTFLIYKAIWFVRRTNSYNLAKGLILILVALWLSDIFKLTMINSLLKRAVELGLIALLILFQPGCGVCWSAWAAASRQARGRKLRNRAGHRADSAGMYGDVRFPHRRAHNL